MRVERIDYLSERGQALARSYQVRAHPAIVIIDASGLAQLNVPGVPTRSQLIEAIERVLQ